ncbi:T9SS type A sorting domain-containing protein [Aureispira]|nr:T9SS type A sorting domain-containing protein [Aureispira sp.]
MQKWLFLCCFILPLFGNAQLLHTPYNIARTDLPEWVQKMYSFDPNPQLVQKSFETYYQDHSFEKDQFTQYYKRWQRQFARRPYWLGMTDVEKKNFVLSKEDYLHRSKNIIQRSPGSVWQSIGPFDFDKTAASTSYACGAAHIYTVEKAKTNADVLYAGTATAGVWKSIDKGKNWQLTTAGEWMTSVRAIEIDHSNIQVVYAASDLDNNLYKTIDGGGTWQIIGDSLFNTLTHYIPDIIMHPDSNNVLLLASSEGLYRTSDGGNNWQQIMAGAFQEIEFHPFLSNIVYVVKQISNKTEFYKSTDNGITFTHKPNGWPVPAAAIDEQKRTEIAVSPADSNKIYALLSGAVGFVSGLYGIYVSTDAGENWSSICCGAHLPNFPSSSNPNLMHWLDDGTGNGGQYYYDLALAVSPTNADSVFVAGVNLWVSADGANTFTCPAQWNHSYKNNYVHADIHDIRLYENEIWVACDGGIFFSTDNGLSFSQRMEGIEGTDFWGFGTGFQDGEVMLGGTFHNGTLLKDNNVYTNDWLSTDGGDNFRGFVHPIYKRIVFSDFGKKILSGDRSVNNVNLPFAHLPHAGLTVGFSGNIAFHPQVYNTVYSTDYYYLWKSENNGMTWEQIYDFGSGLITSLEISWADPDIMYMNYHPSNINADRKIYRTSDGGYNWVDITPDSMTIPTDRWVTYDLSLSATDTNVLWAARVSKYEGSPIMDGKQVYESVDGGQSWQNITTSDLDGVYITNIEHQKGSTGGLYLGTRNAVYYKNSLMPNWELFNNGLPVRTHSVQLIPYYKEGKLRNGTNRSVYDCDFYENTGPIAQISVNCKESNCTRDTFYFGNHSVARANATYLWEFENGVPASSTAENPSVVFAGAGTYSITLTVTDSLGTDSQIMPSFISITDDCGMDTIPGYALNLNSVNDFVKTDGLKLEGDKITISAWVKPDSIQAQYTGIVTHADDSIPAGLMFNANNELMFQWTGASWSWNSGLFVPVDTWSHVALVICPDSAVVYLNGIPSVYNSNLLSLNWYDGLVIGRYADWLSRNFTGLIDEVCIWDHVLTQDEVRSTMHLTKYEIQQPDLLHYYQFNAVSKLVQDRKGTLHGDFYGGSTRIVSSVPVGGGQSHKLLVNSGGSFDFSDAMATLYFSFSGLNPDGEIFVSRLNVTPDQIAGNFLATEGYWIINNYGNNSTFNSLDSFILKSPVQLTSTADKFSVYQRFERGEGSSWGSVKDTCDVILNGNQLCFKDVLNINNLGQFMVASDSPGIVVRVPDTKEVFPQEFLIFPNPIGNNYQITIRTQQSGKYKFSLFNLSGQKVMEKAIYGNDIQLQIPELTTGVYSYSIYSDRTIQTGFLCVD